MCTNFINLESRRMDCGSQKIFNCQGGTPLSKVQLSDENKKIMQQLMWDFKNTKLSTDLNKDIVKLVAEMIAEAIQLSEEQDNQAN